MSERFEHIVVGAGISGLGLAHWAARRGVQTLVLDAGERIGGCINTRVFPGCGDFWVEGGSHTCFNSYGHLLDILGDVGLLNRLTPKAKLRYSLWRGGRRHSVFSALHPLELAISLPRLFTTQKAGRSVRDFYAAGLGAANYRDLFGPAFRAVICQEADDFPADLLFRRKPRRKEVMRSFTLPGGLSEIPLAIAGQTGLEVRTGLSLAEVRGDGDGFRLLLGNGDELACATLTLAVPPDVAAGLLGSVLDKEVMVAIAGIGMREVESLALCVLAEAMGQVPLSAGLISVDDAFNAMVSRDYLPDGSYRGFSFHFRPGELAPEAQEERALAVLGVPPEAVVGRERVHNRLPALRVGHPARVGRIDTALAGVRLGLTGNWFQGVAIEDCLTRSRQECERLFA